jgi:anaerobic selenocysteine-containing dehydrogenase
VSGGRVLEIEGDPDFSITRGFLCRKARTFLPRVFSRDRVLHPMRREGSVWRRISWGQAADLVAGKIEKAVAMHGPLSVLHFQDGGSLAGLKIVNDRLFNLLGGATLASGSLCGGAGIAGQTRDFGLRTAHDPFDLLNSKSIVIWGRNPAWTNVHLLPILSEARRGGAAVAVVDPVATATARLADLHVAPRPGSDAFLALGVAKIALESGSVDGGQIRACSEGYDEFLALATRTSLERISEVTGLNVLEIQELAEMYCSRCPAAIVAGWGLQRRRQGAGIYRFLDSLAVVTGNIGVPGGGVSHGMDEYRWFDPGVALPQAAKERRTIPRPQLGRGILAAAGPAIRVAVISCANPVNQCPDSGVVRSALAAVDFKVVLDMFMTDTAAVADVVLPTTHFLQERDVTASYWHNFVMPVNVAQGRLGGEKTDLEIFSLLAARLGFAADLPPDPEAYIEDLLAPVKADGVSPSRVTEGPVRPGSAVDVPFRHMRFPSASGRFAFVSEIGSDAGADLDYPYYLLSPHPHERLHSQTPGEPEATLPMAYIGRALAEHLSVGTGDRVRVGTRRGNLDCRAEVREGIHAETVMIYEGTWDRLGGGVNRLTPDEVSDQGLSATYNGARCTLTRVGGEG